VFLDGTAHAVNGVVKSGYIVTLQPDTGATEMLAAGMARDQTRPSLTSPMF
jgi:hypothetical protein